MAGHLKRMPKEASRYGFVLRNQTNLNRPRIGESDRGISDESREPGGRTPGFNKLPVWFRAKKSDKPETGHGSANPRIGESQANPESRVAGHLGRMPKEASRYGFVLRNQTNLNGPRIGESTDRGISGESCEPGGRTESTDHGISGES